MTDDPDDPLLKPASDAGWDDLPVKPVKPVVPVVPAAKPVAPPASQASAAVVPPPAPAHEPSLVEALKLADARKLAEALKAAEATKLAAAAKLADAKLADAKLADAKLADAKLADVPKLADAKLADAKLADVPKLPVDAKGAADAKLADATKLADAPKLTDDAKPTAATLADAATPAPSAPAKPAADEPLLPATYNENDLRAAVGATPLPITTPSPRKRHVPASTDADDDDHDHASHAPRNRKAIGVTVLGVAGGLGIIALILLGRINSDRFVLACEPERAVPEQGRAFPPWGTHALAGDAWRPLKITAETRCQPHESDDIIILQRLYLTMLLDQTTAILSAREVTHVDDAELLLKQALLLTRPPEHESDALATERTEHHKEVERMLGDITYWRATARLREASAALTEAAKQFESAAAQHPRHVTDAPAWASYARKLAQELHAGPAGATPPGAPAALAPAAPLSPADHSSIPPGIALPIEPDKPAATAPPAAPPPDAGVPTGGVLL